MPKKTFKIILITTIATVFLIRLFYSLPNAPTLDTDAIFSVEAARNIIETGIPMKNITGEFYDRDYLTHYLLAGSIFLFGESYFSYAILNMIFGVLVLILIYFIGKKITNNKLVIFLSILFVGISSLENTYTINPRSYMQFQFFFLLTVFCFYKGFIEGNKKYKILSIFSYFATPLSHYSGVILMPILGLYLLIKNKKWYKEKNIIIFILATLLFSVILLFINPSKIPYYIFSSMGVINNEGPSNPVGISFSLFDYIYTMFFYLPLFSPFIFLGGIFAVKNKEKKLLYFHYIFWASLFLISLFSKFANLKYFLFLLPLLVLLSFDGVDKFIKYIIQKTKESEPAKIKTFFGVILFIFFLLVIKYTPYSSLGFKSYFTDHSGAISHISENKQKNDIIICTDPTICTFYLNQCDYFLQQKEIEKEGQKIIWTKLDPQYKKLYKIGFVDNLDDLREIMSNNKRTWIILNKKFFSTEIDEYIKKNTELKYEKLNEHDYSVSVFLFENKEK